MIVTIVVVLGVVLLGIKGKKLLEKRKEEITKESLPSSIPISVVLVRPTEGELQKYLSFLAQLLAQKNINITTKLSGYIERITVDEAQVVKQGELLVTIDDAEIRSSIEALKSTIIAQKSDMHLAFKIYQRNQLLYKKGGLAKEKLESSKVAYEMKRAAVKSNEERLEQLMHQLAYLHIKAPFEGVVDTVLLHEGDLAAAGKPILSLSDHNQKLLFTYAPEEVNGTLVGKPVFFKGEPIGEVRVQYPISKSGLNVAEAYLKKRVSLPIGANITIDIPVRQAKGCILPTDTLLHKKEGTFVLVYKGKQFVPLKIKVILEDGEMAVITPCPHDPVARGSESKLTALQAYGNVTIAGEVDAQ